jgi:AcrR family transcriptional regulator
VARRPAPDTRRRILATASNLFYKRGVRAVGMQEVVTATGTGKSLLYREFASKDELVVAWLTQERERWRTESARELAARAGDPAGQLLAIVGMVAEEIRAPDYRGCPFLNITTEFPDPENPGHRQAVAHLDEMRGTLEELARAAGAADPAALANYLTLVIDGMYTNGAALGPAGPAAAGTELAATLVGLYCPATPAHQLMPSQQAVPSDQV